MLWLVFGRERKGARILRRLDHLAIGYQWLDIVRLVALLVVIVSLQVVGVLSLQVGPELALTQLVLCLWLVMGCSVVEVWIGQARLYLFLAAVLSHRELAHLQLRTDAAGQAHLYLFLTVVLCLLELALQSLLRYPGVFLSHGYLVLNQSCQLPQEL